MKRPTPTDHSPSKTADIERVEAAIHILVQTRKELEALMRGAHYSVVSDAIGAALDSLPSEDELDDINLDHEEDL